MVKCVDDKGNERPDKECPGQKPKATKRCKRKRCPKWFAGPWSRCSVTCGVGTRHREVQCRLDEQKGMNPRRCSKEKRPKAVEQCSEVRCSDYEWRKSVWSECSRTCGFGTKSRLVSCVNKHGDKVSSQFCDTEKVPKSTRRCSEIPCPFIWNTGGWSECSASCGEGKQVRWVVCQAVSKEGWILPGEVSYACKPHERPPQVQRCNYGHCEASFRWVVGPWGQCTKACGKGRARRKVICVDKMGKQQKQRYCVASLRPKRSKACYLGPCYAKSCKHLKDLTKIKLDGEYKLLVHGRFIEVYCKHMRKSEPKEYITLPAGEEENFSEIYTKRLVDQDTCPYNGSRREMCTVCHKQKFKEAGLTKFSKIRIDLRLLQVNIQDFAFSKTLQGKRIPYGTAGDCYSSKQCPQGKFSINLIGTGLVVIRNASWVLQGNRGTKQIQNLRNGELVRGVCGGACGRCSPSSFNMLQLELRP